MTNYILVNEAMRLARDVKNQHEQEPVPTVELHGITDAKQGSRVLFKVTPSIAGKTITLDIENSLGAAAGFSATLTRKFLDTEDRAIRAALVALGWTPPPEKSEP